MFKNLKKKLEQGVAQSTIKGAIASAAKASGNDFLDWYKKWVG